MPCTTKTLTGDVMTKKTKDIPRILGKDKWHRIIYQGDVLSYDDLFEVKHYRAVGKFRDSTLEMTRFLSLYCGDPMYMEIDLKRSPKYTNYDRYFADICPHGVIKIMLSPERDSDGKCRLSCDCSNCPFEDFPEFIGREDMTCTESFLWWLDRKALR